MDQLPVISHRLSVIIRVSTPPQHTGREQAAERVAESGSIRRYLSSQGRGADEDLPEEEGRLRGAALHILTNHFIHQVDSALCFFQTQAPLKRRLTDTIHTFVYKGVCLDYSL